jgi:DNA-binding NarL/FixJ family response regulator
METVARRLQVAVAVVFDHQVTRFCLRSVLHHQPDSTFAMRSSTASEAIADIPRLQSDL